jgi:histidine ammonia-lyase
MNEAARGIAVHLLADAVFLAIERVLLALCDVAAIVARRHALLMVDLPIFLVQRHRLLRGQLALLALPVNALALAVQPMVHFMAARVFLLPACLGLGAGGDAGCKDRGERQSGHFLHD